MFMTVRILKKEGIDQGDGPWTTQPGEALFLLSPPPGSPFKQCVCEIITQPDKEG